MSGLTALAAAASRLAFDVPVAGHNGPIPPAPDPRFGASIADKLAGAATRFEHAALNPQPLPPGPTDLGSILAGGIRHVIDDWCGTVPKRPHIPPPPPPPLGESIGGLAQRGM